MIRIGQWTVVYDRQANEWQLTGDSETIGFGTGAVAQQKAIQSAIRQAHPRLATAVERLITKHPATQSRAWNAARLLIDGHVLAPGIGAASRNLAWVVSQRGGLAPRHYHISPVGDSLHCTCRDYAQGGVEVDVHILCKHILAYRLGCYLDWPLKRKQPHGRRKEPGGVHRGRTVTRVNGSASHANGHANRRVNGCVNGHAKGHANGPVTHDPSAHLNQPPTFANGDAVTDQHKLAYDTVVAAMRCAPVDAEKLASWYYGR